MGNVHMEAKDINYRGGQKKMSVEEALKNTSGEAAAIAQLQSDVADLNDTKANLITIAPVFSAETAYDPGDLVYHNGLTYRCVNSHEGEWDADDFAATTIANELSSLESGLTRLVQTTLTYSESDGGLIIPSGVPRPSQQYTMLIRILESGSIYVVWYADTYDAFIISDKISGTDIADGEHSYVTYIASAT